MPLNKETKPKQILVYILTKHILLMCYVHTQTILLVRFEIHSLSQINGEDLKKNGFLVYDTKLDGGEAPVLNIWEV